MMAETCEGCRWQGERDGAKSVRCICPTPQTDSVGCTDWWGWVGGKSAPRAECTRYEPKPAPTCADCAKCPPKPEDRSPVKCEHYNGPRPGGWSAWFRGGDTSGVGDKSTCFIPKTPPTPALPDGQCCGRCATWIRNEMNCEHDGSEYRDTGESDGADCPLFLDKDTPTLCNTCVSCPDEIVGKPVEAWGDARCHHGTSNRNGCLLSHKYEGVRGRACEEYYKPRFAPTLAEPEDPPLPDQDRLVAEGLERTGEIRYPKSDEWFWSYEGGGKPFLAGASECASSRQQYNGDRHILRKLEDPPRTESITEGWVYTGEIREPNDVDRYASPATGIVLGPKGSPVKVLGYGKRRRIVERIEAAECGLTCEPCRWRLPKDGDKAVPCGNPKTKGRLFSWWEGGEVPTRCGSFYEPKTPPPHEPVDGQCCGVCGSWANTTENPNWCSHSMVKATRVAVGGTTCRAFTSRPAPATNCLKCEHCPELTEDRNNICNCGWYHISRDGTRAGCTKPCEHFTPKTPPKTAKPTLRVMADFSKMGVTMKDAKAAFKTLSAALRGGHETLAGKDATMTETTKITPVPFTKRPVCPACTSTSFDDVRFWTKDANEKMPDPHLARTCKKCRFTIGMAMAVNSPKTEPRDGSSLATRAAWKTAKVLAIVAWWAIRNPVHAAAYGYGGHWFATGKLPQHLFTLAWNAAGLG